MCGSVPSSLHVFSDAQPPLVVSGFPTGCIALTPSPTSAPVVPPPPPPANVAAASAGGSSGVIAIAAGTAGGFAVLVVAVLAFLAYRMRSRRRHIWHAEKELMQEDPCPIRLSLDPVRSQ